MPPDQRNRTQVNVVLILDANQRSALAATRSLGQRRHLSVITSDSTPWSLAASSRYSDLYVQYPCPARDPVRFIERIRRIVEEHGVTYLQPTTEITSRTLLEHRPDFRNVILPFSDYQTVMAVCDKSALTKTAETIGVPVPRSEYFSRLEDWDRTSLPSFPFIIKPALSKIHENGSWINTTVRKICDSRQLADVLRRDTYLAEHPFMVQEFIPGHGAGVFALARNGEVLCKFAHERLREKPPGGGVSVLCRSARINSDLSHYTDRLMRAYGWSGVAMVEFRISDSGRPYLMEINTRFWGSLQLSIDSGMDFPYLLYQVFNGEHIDHQPHYQVGNQLRWYLGDLDNLLITWKDEAIPISRKLRHLANFLKIHRETRHEIFRLADPSPAVFEFKSYVSDLLGVS